MRFTDAAAAVVFAAVRTFILPNPFPGGSENIFAIPPHIPVHSRGSIRLPAKSRPSGPNPIKIMRAGSSGSNAFGRDEQSPPPRPHPLHRERANSSNDFEIPAQG
ncbi:hypothetical protein IscW_ISCW009927 [Ixodes scapularis]|uniref:Uncharacterized protein n=1 Tax=Ixodes scapularis TaxID=6945 RepID=B7Q1B9_IXOSC|nr:hypothetical protein IscW_ISCW009927 [Ixodes scapularis]|eukprot:XP_002409296.1 hypothetical protein IscW_ISCW009927 [Ixodes scapularis]